MTIDLKYWRNRLAAQEHSGSSHVGLTTAQFAEILDEVEAGRVAIKTALDNLIEDYHLSECAISIQDQWWVRQDQRIVECPETVPCDCGLAVVFAALRAALEPRR